MPHKDGLVVTVSPSASAFFAGELFTATITFTNSHSPPTPPPSALQQQQPRTASGSVPSSWRTLTPTSGGRNRPPSASHVGLADYATQHLNSDEVPPSPYLRSSSGGHFPATTLASASTSQLPSPSPTRPTFKSAQPPHSAGLPPTSPSKRSAAGQPPLPTRKGLIGKQPAKEPPKPVGGGLYAGGPRRPGGPGGLLRGHGRAQSMAISSPDLLGRGGGDVGSRHASAPMQGRGGHAKGRFGGSVAGEVTGLNGGGALPSSPSRGLPAPVEEEASPTEELKPDFPEDAAFPPSQSSSAPAPSHFPRRPTFGHRRQSSNHPYGHNTRASLSTLSLASDDDSDEDPNEAASSRFYGLGRNDTMESIVEADYHRAARDAGPLNTNRFSSAPAPSPYAPQPGHDREAYRSQSYSNGNPSPHNSAPLHPPNTLSLLWAFAHLEGSFEVDESLVKPGEFMEVKRLIAGGLAGAGVGGGTLEERKETAGWKGWLWGSKPATQEDGRGAASLEERKERAVKDRSVPTFSCPPSILGVDLVLEPGKSKTFTFSIRVPADLPPSFRGKAIKFNYHLVVGSNRTLLGPTPHPAQVVGYKRESVSRVMRVPVRVYNHVGMTGARPFYDLTNPIIYQRDEATATDADNPKVPIRKIPRLDTGKQDFEAYAANLLDSVVTNSPEIIQNAALSPTLEQARSPMMMEAPPQLRPEMSSRAGGGAGEGGFGMEVEEGGGCKAAVEVVSRNSQKVSYDINKDGYQVASLTLVKSAYRLGETVNGSVVINSGEGRVLRVSARLETHELVETSISTLPAPRMRQYTRRLHSEHHEMTLDSARVGFALAIPSGATPDFGTSGVKLQWSVRLSFLIIPPSPDAPANNPNLPPERRRALFGSRAPPPPPPPPPQNGPPSRHGRSKSFAYGFEPAVPLTLPGPPMIAPSGAAHLMPVLPRAGDPSPPQHVSYRAVPDLGFVPVPFSSAAPEPPPAPGPLQKTAAGAHHRTTPSVSIPRNQSPMGNGSVVLVPAKVETVECSIPIKVFPSNTPFRPTVTIFDA